MPRTRTKKYDPPVVEADSADDKDFQFKLPRTRLAEPIIKGVKGHKTSDGYLVLRLHYSCDPDRANDEWLDEQVKGYRGSFSGRDWLREMEIDFESYAGEPVYPEFAPTLSVRPVKYRKELPLWRGWDFGFRNPAVTFYQYWPDDTLVFLHEIFPTLNKEVVPGISTGDLAKVVLSETDRLFPGISTSEGAGVFDFCDPAGNQKKETSDYSSVEILQAHGIYPEFNVMGRKTRIAYARRYVEGKFENGEPKFLINPHCKLGIEAFSAAYRYPEEGKGSNDNEMPDLGRKVQQDPHIHIMDSFEYVVAANLEVDNPSAVGHKQATDDQPLIQDLASVYLGVSQGSPDSVESRHKGHSLDDHLEATLVDYIGEDSLEDAWLNV